MCTYLHCFISAQGLWDNNNIPPSLSHFSSNYWIVFISIHVKYIHSPILKRKNPKPPKPTLTSRFYLITASFIYIANLLIGYSVTITCFFLHPQPVSFRLLFIFSCYTWPLIWNVPGLTCLPTPFSLQLLAPLLSVSLRSYSNYGLQYNLNTDFSQIYISTPKFCLGFSSIYWTCYSAYPFVYLIGISIFLGLKQNSQLFSSSLIMSLTFASCPRPKNSDFSLISTLLKLL